MPALAHLPQHRASPLSKNPASGCWANLRRHTSLLARRQASTYTHVRLGLPTSLAPCLARNLTQHRAQIDPLPARRAPSPVGKYATAWISAEISKPVTSGRVMTARV